MGFRWPLAFGSGPAGVRATAGQSGEFAESSKPGRARALAYARRMGDRENEPVGVFRDEAQDIIPVGIGPFLAAARGRVVENDLRVPGIAEDRGSNDAVYED